MRRLKQRIRHRADLELTIGTALLVVILITFVASAIK
jgi:hypothetical protein